MRSRVVPYLLALPAWLWLAAFFVAPLCGMLSVSLMTGDLVHGFRQTFHFATYAEAVRRYPEQLLRSLCYGGAATALCLALGYPVAYWIARRGGRARGGYLLLLVLPFFVPFVLRTVAWQFLLADDGLVLGALKDAGLLPAGAGVLNSAPAVVLGLACSHLPFMVLPIYAVLERLDRGLVEAARDLYAGPAAAFLRIVLPYSLPGVSAGVLMTFVPASSDYVTAALLGGTRTTMIGNVIQTQYLVNNAYPTAAALTFILMALLLLGVLGYALTAGIGRVTGERVR
ncbi:ABC transporter permease [Marinactinospora rubrisoli]|uniref:ABC transporter permease n=1 Tax=Marinactinospora rubrisoli TaxID=2715399 RepID=A0ABW2KBD8_9ACTN